MKVRQTVGGIISDECAGAYEWTDEWATWEEVHHYVYHEINKELIRDRVRRHSVNTMFDGTEAHGWETGYMPGQNGPQVRLVPS